MILTSKVVTDQLICIEFISNRFKFERMKRDEQTENSGPCPDGRRPYFAEQCLLLLLLLLYLPLSSLLRDQKLLV